MTHLEKARRSVEARGLPYYHSLNKQYPIHYASFSRMHGRIWRDKLSTDFPRDFQGFKDFIAYLGDIPVGMNNPTVGRKDHSLGYVKGNFEWQSKSKNSSECSSRTKSGKLNILQTPCLKKRQNLLNFIKTITTDTLITDQLVLQLNYNYKKDLIAAIRGLSKLKSIGRKYYITI
jgi:hypothetical protein